MSEPGPDHRPTAVNQFHSGTAVGDAITDEMLLWRAHLRELGYRSEILAEHIHPGLTGEIRPITSYLGDAGALLIVHHSMGHGAFETVLGLPDRKAMAFHNITPERFFDDEHTKRHVRLGHRQLRRFAPHAAAAVADSAFNRRELLRAGFPRASVIPVKTSFPAFDTPSARTTTGDWLFVGRVAPNKHQLELVDAFSVLARNDAITRLNLVGDLSYEPYVRRVREQIQRAGIEHRVVLHGKVSDARLRQAYQRAGTFVSLSEHEGFGVPLLEAMAAGLPVVARAVAAVPETMEGAGLLLTDEGPEEIAHIVHAMTSDPAWRARIVAEQHARISRLEAFDVRAALERLISEAMGERPPLEIQVQGPFETSYSLAVLNRSLALELDGRPDVNVSIYATEGPGDYVPRDEDLATHQEAAQLHARSARIPYPDVVIRQLHPPRVHDAPGAVNLLYFGWEETRIPAEHIEQFNEHLDGIGTMSSFVATSLVESGLEIIVEPTGVGVEPPHIDGSADLAELDDLPGYRFLHISSAFPRKGVDVLLRAYFDAFTGVDDVVLVLKTFPNPHNEVGPLLSRLRAETPNPPDVRWINRDVPRADLDRLYGIASCYVHAARGEGFGLPVAEAMLARVPVIAIAQSGTADFVDDDVAITVPYRMRAAETHLSVEGSEWAEPDLTSLAQAMHAAWTCRDDAQLAQRVSAAHERISREHTWSVVADKWLHLIERAGDALFTPNVALVTTWNSRCGIAEHSRQLVDSLGRRVAVEIFADRDVTVVDQRAEAGVVRDWGSRWQPDLSALQHRLLQGAADVVHIQFQFSFFEPFRLSDLLVALDRDGRATVLTLHGTHDPVIDGEIVRLSDIALTLSRVDRIIVHQAHDAERLAVFGITDNVELLPLGATVGGLPTRAAVRDALRLGHRAVIATFGFALPHKGLLELIRAIGLLRPSRPDVLLLACCAIHPDPSSIAYFGECEREIATLGLGDVIRLVPDFLAEDEARTILSAADLIVLPYGDTAESSSAALRFVIGVGGPVMTTAIPIFDDAADALHQVSSNDPTILATGIDELLSDEARRCAIAERCAGYARSVSWSAIGRRHAEIYREVARRRRASDPLLRALDP